MTDKREKELLELLHDLSEDRVEQLSEQFEAWEKIKQLHDKRNEMELELIRKLGEHKKEFIEYLDAACNVQSQAESFFYSNGFLDCLGMVRIILFKFED